MIFLAFTYGESRGGAHPYPGGKASTCPNSVEKNLRFSKINRWTGTHLERPNGGTIQLNLVGNRSFTIGKRDSSWSASSSETKQTPLIHIISYIKMEVGKFSHLPGEVPFGQDKKDPPGQEQQKLPPSGFIISFIIVVSTLILVLLFASHVRELERKMHGKK